jgi:histidinol-phosphate phosphatase family protein
MNESAGRPAVFLDRDGTLMNEVEYCSDPALVEILPGVREGLARLSAAGFRLIVITNQSGIGRGYFSTEKYEAVHARMLELLGSGVVDASYMCPDHPDQPTERRKPGPGMILEAAGAHGIDLAASYMIGDRESDVQAGRRAGAKSILLRTGYGREQPVDGAVFVAENFAEAVDFILREQ